MNLLKTLVTLMTLSTLSFASETKLCDRIDLEYSKLSNEERAQLWPDYTYLNTITEVCQQHFKNKNLNLKQALKFNKSIGVLMIQAEKWFQKNEEEIERISVLCLDLKCDHLNDDEASVKRIAKTKDLIVSMAHDLRGEIRSHYQYDLVLFADIPDGIME